MVTKNGPFQMTVGQYHNVFQYKVTDQRTPYVTPFLKTQMNKSSSYTNEL